MWNTCKRRCTIPDASRIETTVLGGRRERPSARYVSFEPSVAVNRAELTHAPEPPQLSSFVPGPCRCGGPVMLVVRRLAVNEEAGRCQSPRGLGSRSVGPCSQLLPKHHSSYSLPLVHPSGSAAAAFCQLGFSRSQDSSTQP